MSEYTIDNEALAAAIVAGTEWDVFDPATSRVKKVNATQMAAFTPGAKFTTAALAAGTLAAGAITGADFNVLQNTGATPGNQTTRTAAQMLADTPNGYVGQVQEFRIVNTGAGTLTLVMDASVTGTGTLTVATNTFRDYLLTFLTTTTASIQSVGSGTSP